MYWRSQIKGWEGEMDGLDELRRTVLPEVWGNHREIRKLNVDDGLGISYVKHASSLYWIEVRLMLANTKNHFCIFFLSRIKWIFFFLVLWSHWLKIRSWWHVDNSFVLNVYSVEKNVCKQALKWEIYLKNINVKRIFWVVE